MDDQNQIDVEALIKQLTARETIARDKAISEAKYGDMEAGKRWLARADQLREVIMLIDSMRGRGAKL